MDGTGERGGKGYSWSQRWCTKKREEGGDSHIFSLSSFFSLFSIVLRQVCTTPRFREREAKIHLCVLMHFPHIMFELFVSVFQSTAAAPLAWSTATSRTRTFPPHHRSTSSRSGRTTQGDAAFRTNFVVFRSNRVFLAYLFFFAKARGPLSKSGHSISKTSTQFLV